MLENGTSQKDLEMLQGHLSHHISNALTSCVSEETGQIQRILVDCCKYH